MLVSLTLEIKCCLDSKEKKSTLTSLKEEEEGVVEVVIEEVTEVVLEKTEEDTREEEPRFSRIWT